MSDGFVRSRSPSSSASGDGTGGSRSFDNYTCIDSHMNRISRVNAVSTGLTFIAKGNAVIGSSVKIYNLLSKYGVWDQDPSVVHFHTRMQTGGFVTAEEPKYQMIQELLVPYPIYLEMVSPGTVEKLGEMKERVSRPILKRRRKI